MHFIFRFSVVVVSAEAKILKVFGVNKFDLLNHFSWGCVWRAGFSLFGGCMHKYSPYQRFIIWAGWVGKWEAFSGHRILSHEFVGCSHGKCTICDQNSYCQAFSKGCVVLPSSGQPRNIFSRSLPVIRNVVSTSLAFNRYVWNNSLRCIVVTFPHHVSSQHAGQGIDDSGHDQGCCSHRNIES